MLEFRNLTIDQLDDINDHRAIPYIINYLEKGNIEDKLIALKSIQGWSYITRNECNKAVPYLINNLCEDNQNFIEEVLSTLEILDVNDNEIQLISKIEAVHMNKNNRIYAERIFENKGFKLNFYVKIKVEKVNDDNTIDNVDKYKIASFDTRKNNDNTIDNVDKNNIAQFHTRMNNDTLMEFISSGDFDKILKAENYIRDNFDYYSEYLDLIINPLMKNLESSNEEVVFLTLCILNNFELPITRLIEAINYYDNYKLKKNKAMIFEISNKLNSQVYDLKYLDLIISPLMKNLESSNEEVVFLTLCILDNLELPITSLIKIKKSPNNYKLKKNKAMMLEISNKIMDRFNDLNKYIFKCNITKINKKIDCYYNAENGVYLDEPYNIFFWGCYYPVYRGSYNNSVNSLRNRIIGLKENKPKDIDFFYDSINSLIGSNIVICNVPSSTAYNMNGVNNLTKKLSLVNGRLDGSEVLIRHKSIPKQAYGGSRSVEQHLSTIRVDKPELIKNQIVLLIDDISTTGCSLTACKKLLMDDGALYVLPFSLLRTVSL